MEYGNLLFWITYALAGLLGTYLVITSTKNTLKSCAILFVLFWVPIANIFLVGILAKAAHEKGQLDKN